MDTSQPNRGVKDLGIEYLGDQDGSNNILIIPNDHSPPKKY
jgi:hypothetical protein